jgi:glycosyltransferase involved in cell wall biosynthesis
LIARQLAQETDTPWVAEFRDLWSDWAHVGHARGHRELALEHRLLHAATSVVTVSPTYASVLAGKGARRVAVVTNGFDPEDFHGHGSSPLEPVAAYLGTYYPEAQDLHPALAALKVSHERGSGLRFRLIGPPSAGVSAAIRRAGMEEHSDCTGFLPHAEALEAVRRARILVLAGPISAKSDVMRGHLAAKTFEYLGARRPILVVTDPDTDLAALLQPFAHVRCVAPGDVAAAARALQELLQPQPDPPDQHLRAFTSGELTRRLAHVLEQAHQVERQ